MSNILDRGVGGLPEMKFPGIILMGNVSGTGNGEVVVKEQGL